MYTSVIKVGDEVKSEHIRSKNILFVACIVLCICALFAVSANAASTKSATGLVNSKEGAYIRKSSTTSSSKVMLAKNNTKLTISKVVFKKKSSTSSKNKWYYVTCSGKKGYIRADLVDNIKYSAVQGQVTGTLNYRAGAGTGMKSYGKLKKGKKLTIYLSAKDYKTSITWYLTKVGSKYRYVSGNYVKIVGSILENPGGSSSSSSSSSSGSSSGSSSSSGKDVSKMTDAQYKDYLTKLGFPSSYVTKLLALHKKHPNWIFTPKMTGLNFSTVASKESKDGVSLIEGCQPIAWRDTSSYSYKSSTAYLYSSASTSSTKLVTLPDNASVKILSEKFDKSKVKWTKVSVTVSGKSYTGYTKESFVSQTYPVTIQGKLNDSDVNIRTGAGTNHSAVGSANKNDTVSIVLTAIDKDGDTWYKIKRGTGYAYIIKKYVTVSSSSSATRTVETLSANYPVAKAKANVVYYARPDEDYPKLGDIKTGETYSAVSSVSDAKGNTWYRLCVDERIVYAKASSFDVSGTVKAGTIPAEVTGITTDALNYRTGAGTSYTVKGTFGSGTKVTITDVVYKSGYWFKVKVGSSVYYASADYIDVNLESAPSDAATVVSSVKETKAVSTSSLYGTAKVKKTSGSYIPKDGSNWFNASPEAVKYYLDPRNFLDETRVFMFEDLSYNSAYHTTTVVSAILNGTKLPGNGFTSKIFVDAGAKYKISPVHLAARARQETGGGSIAITGYKISGKVVYNPFNIGATSSSNPVMNGLKYAYNKGWTTQAKAVSGGAEFIAKGYINAGQNSPYFQKWNVANGSAKVATHQYMTNIMAPYYEAASTKSSYTKYGILNKSLTFVIPVYNSMPSSTSLPN